MARRGWLALRSSINVLASFWRRVFPKFMAHNIFHLLCSSSFGIQADRHAGACQIFIVSCGVKGRLLYICSRATYQPLIALPAISQAASAGAAMRASSAPDTASLSPASPKWRRRPRMAVGAISFRALRQYSPAVPPYFGTALMLLQTFVGMVMHAIFSDSDEQCPAAPMPI